ncbi:MAG: hypothetical protein GXP56_00950 [Deltaproteobacteria bacterium]|nr:hypothetical protein [Deltaproteobacteria bacterium]
MTSLYLRRHHTKILMGHGAGFGNSKQNENIEDYYIKIALADGTHVNFINSVAKCKNAFNKAPWLEERKNKAFFVTGFPKVDTYFTSIKSGRVNFLQTLGLSPEKKTIVIFSHWTENSLFRNKGFELVKKLISSDKNYNIIINGHEKLWFDPGSVNGPTASSNLYDSLAVMEKEHSNLCFLPVVKDLKPLLESGDLFIADYSSVFIECCIMDKPILFFHHPDFIFMNEQVGKLYMGAAFNFNQPEGICDLCTKALEYKNLHKEQRHMVVDFFFDNKGTSAQYIADLLVDMGRVYGPKSFGWKRVKQLSRQNLTNFKIS